MTSPSLLAEELRPGNITDEELADQEIDEEFYPDEAYGEPGAALDPDPRRRGPRRGRMPPALARYWRTHPRRPHRARPGYYSLYDPRHRRHRTRRMDPRRRRHRSYRMDPRPRHYTVRYIGVRSPRRRHHRPRFGLRRMFDPAIAAPAGAQNFWGAIFQPIVTTIGGLFHNYMVTRYPKVAGGFKVGNSAVGYLGLAGGALGAGLDITGKSAFGSMANAFGSGMLTEAINAPQTEGVATIPTMNAFRKSGGMVGPHMVQSLPSMQPGTF